MLTSVPRFRGRQMLKCLPGVHKPLPSLSTADRARDDEMLRVWYSAVERIEGSTERRKLEVGDCLHVIVDNCKKKCHRQQRSGMSMRLSPQLTSCRG
eukprot:COSAG06_NODE_438_length_15766_cov_6.128997_2_plen_97_part_00